MFKQIFSSSKDKNNNDDANKSATSMDKFDVQTPIENHVVNDISKQLYEKGITSSENRLALIVDNFLSKEECENLIKITEARGYEEALVNIGNGAQRSMRDVRNSDRCMIDDERVASLFYQKCQKYIPDTFGGRSGSSKSQCWIKTGINERLRFLRYQKGGYFKPHFDGSYIRPNGEEQSFVTFFLFLNEGCQGGSSTFVSMKSGGDNFPCEPVTGRLVIFEHHIFHEGSLVKGGVKYALRSDFMYKRMIRNNIVE